MHSAQLSGASQTTSKNMKKERYSKMGIITFYANKLQYEMFHNNS
jgi:hypothetical protein